jgi:hypothetical protein
MPLESNQWEKKTEHSCQYQRSHTVPVGKEKYGVAGGEQILECFPVIYFVV